MKFFSLLHPQKYAHFQSLFPACKACRRCYRSFEHKGLLKWEDIIESVRSGNPLTSLLQFSSQAEEDRLNFLMSYCRICRWNMQTPSESDDSEDDQAEDDDEQMGFIESELEDDEDSLGDLKTPRVEHGQMEDCADADSSDESSSDEDLGGEQIGWEHSYV